MPSNAPSEDMMKMTEIQRPRLRRGATSPTLVLTMARSAPTPIPVITRARMNWV